jgi:hypothetical protein
MEGAIVTAADVWPPTHDWAAQKTITGTPARKLTGDGAREWL